MTDSLFCWKCGSSIVEHPLPLSRTAECRQCNADLHVCKLCRFYNTRMSNQCEEPIADEIKDKERSNFCDYFEIKPNAFTAIDNSRAEAAEAALKALFGDPSSAIKQDTHENSSSDKVDPLTDLEDFFKK